MKVPAMKFFRLLCLAVSPLVLLPQQVSAAEGGLGTYLLGSKGPSAGVTPGPGWYFQNDLYLYSGSIGRDADLPLNGRLSFGVEGSAVLSIPTIIYVSPAEVAGGRLGFTASLPMGRKNVDVDYSYAGPRGNGFTGAQSDGRNMVGDPKLGAFLGWNTGNWHYQVSTQINVPIGDYDNDRLANLSFNRWSGDLIGAVTWLNPQTGLDLSGTMGVTFNGENKDTDYKTGTELHLEAAAIQHFNKQFDAGIMGYHYEQVSSDSGDGASSDFKGRVSALGVTAGYNMLIHDRPVSLRVKYLKEFNTRNRAEGETMYMTISIPLGG